MAKKNFYLASKRSEYRNNYLPFDYYDFWITAKENQNLRCRNKIRDYIHTPFDWDEDQEIYLESYDSLNQATQTSERPKTVPAKKIAKNNLKNSKNFKSDKENLNIEQDENYSRDHFYHQQHDKNHHHHHHNHHHSNQNLNHNHHVHYDFDEDKHHHGHHHHHHHHDQQHHKNHNQKNNKNQNKKSKQNDVKWANETKEEGIQINVPEYENVPRHRRVRSSSAKIQKTINNNNNNMNMNDLKNNLSKSNLKNKFESKSITNMSVQTPSAWNLRDYKKNKQDRNLFRSASLSNLQPKRPPFANYGWATRTKDLSIKPTHNALANKNLAKHNDKDAIIELTLQRLKKDATLMANEYSAIESYSAEKHHTGRSESKSWHSEYDEKYPDYTHSNYKNELYHSRNPYRLIKSSLISNYPPLRRGPKSAKKKIHYLD